MPKFTITLTRKTSPATEEKAFAFRYSLSLLGQLLAKPAQDEPETAKPIHATSIPTQEAA